MTLHEIEKKLEQGNYKVMKRIYDTCCPEGDCMIWKGKVSSAGGLPVMRHAGSAATTVRRVVASFKFNRKLNHREFAVNTCGNKLCVAWGCVKVMDVSEVRKRDGAKGIYSTASVSAKRASVARSKGKLTMEQAREIRLHPGTQQELAEIYGVNRSHIGRIRSGKKMKDYSSPFAGLLR